MRGAPTACPWCSAAVWWLTPVLPRCLWNQAVMAWHAAGVLHLDIKPANVATTAAGEVVVLDAGLSAFTTAGSAVVHGPVGTPGYMAPELRGHGEHVAVAACDVFSLGATYRTALDRWVRIHVVRA